MRVADQTLEAFCSQLAAGTPTPGGGAAAAVTGAIGAALVAMVAGLSVGREKYAAVHEEMETLQRSGVRESQVLLQCADEDQDAFERVMAAFALPRTSEEEKAERRKVIETAYQAATMPPLTTMEHSLVVMRGALAAASRGNPNALSDAYVAYLTASAAFEGGLWNVAINLGTIKDDGFKEQVLSRVNRLRSERTTIAAAFHSLTPDPVQRFLGQ